MSALREKKHTSSALLLERQSMRQEAWKCVVSLALSLSNTPYKNASLYLSISQHPHKVLHFLYFEHMQFDKAGSCSRSLMLRLW